VSQAEQGSAATRPNESRALYLQIVELLGRVQKVRYWSPRQWRHLCRYRREQENLRPRYESYVSETEHAEAGPGGFAQHESIFSETPAEGRFQGRSLGSLVVIMQQWSALDAALDWKTSYGLAAFSLYVAVFSLLMSALSLWLALC
jgi:hypothetical protein